MTLAPNAYTAGAHPGYTNPIVYPTCKFATSQARWSYHSTSQPAYESPSASWYILPASIYVVYS